MRRTGVIVLLMKALSSKYACAPPDPPSRDHLLLVCSLRLRFSGHIDLDGSRWAFALRGGVGLGTMGYLGLKP